MSSTITQSWQIKLTPSEAWLCVDPDSRAHQLMTRDELARAWLAGATDGRSVIRVRITPISDETREV